MRLDVFLFENGFVKSREYGKTQILSKKVSVNKNIISQPSFNVSSEDKIDVMKNENTFVGRGGYKLLKALEVFKINVDDFICMDIGASTGGFSDCLLQKNARLIYAVDVGTSQLDESLIKNNKVINMEKTNIRDVNKKLLCDIDFICCDVSFISIKQIIPIVYELLKNNKSAVLLIKPQFEIGKSRKLKKGVLNDIESHKKILYNIINFANEKNLSVCNLDFSPIKGAKGNIEYLLYCVKNGTSVVQDIDKVIKNAKDNLKDVLRQ